jgi:hypothetical protein
MTEVFEDQERKKSMDSIYEDAGAPGSSAETDRPELTAHPVGYGNPPMTRRFKQGQSGNPSGRPRGSKNRKTIVKRIANEMHAVTEDGRRRRRSTLELMLLALRNRAAEGNFRAFRAFKKYLTKFEPQDTPSKLGFLVVPAGLTEEEFIKEAEKSNAEADALHAARTGGKS